jgi:hypothetical protein
MQETVLFASLLEVASLNAALFFVPGRAFVGWQTGDFDEAAPLRRRTTHRRESMERVVVQVNATSDQVSFRWSDGTGEFKAYHLRGQAVREFRASAERSRQCLDRLVGDYLAWVNAADTQRAPYDADLHASSAELAVLGHDLYQRLFRPVDPDERARAERAKGWLERLRNLDLVQSLEVVLEGSLSVPWNALYDESPVGRGSAPPRRT